MNTLAEAVAEPLCSPGKYPPHLTWARLADAYQIPTEPLLEIFDARYVTHPDGYSALAPTYGQACRSHRRACSPRSFRRCLCQLWRAQRRTRPGCSGLSPDSRESRPRPPFPHLRSLWSPGGGSGSVVEAPSTRRASGRSPVGSASRSTRAAGNVATRAGACP